MKNATAHPGTIDSKVFGEVSRFRVEAFRTRFNTVTFFVTDAEAIDPETGLPAVIRQKDTLAEAVAGLLGDGEAVPALRIPEAR